MFLIKFIAIQDNSLFMLYNGYLAEFPVILDSFITGLANITIALLVVIIIIMITVQTSS